MGKFHIKPVPIIAHRVGDDGWPDEIWDGVNKNKIILHLDSTGHPRKTFGYVEVSTPAGVVRARIGDWIIRGENGDFSTCKPDVFAQTYEPEKAGA